MVSEHELELRDLRNAYLRGDNMLAIHYSCEDFYEVQDRPARVSCISVCRIRDEDIRVFSPNGFAAGLSAEEKEIALLREFFLHLKVTPDAQLVHWNMNSAPYGFAALAARFEYLMGTKPPYMPPTERLHDLDAVIEHQFGEHYAKHPKLLHLARLNDRGMRFFLKGADEAERLRAGDFGSIERSSAEKAKLISQLFVRLVTGALQTENSAGSIRFASEYLDAVRVVLQLAERLSAVQRSLKKRRRNKVPLTIEDEHDAQYLLKALLRVFFDDIRDEEWTPSYAGGSSRIDFLLPDFGLAIELKKTRSTLTAPELGEELLVDSQKYQTHPSVRHLVCVVFDEDGWIENPRGIEADLQRMQVEPGFAMTVRILEH